jgi:hypothetical protein
LGRSFVREPNVRAESVAAVVSPSVTGKRRGDSLFSREALMLVSAYKSITPPRPVAAALRVPVNHEYSTVNIRF